MKKDGQRAKAAKMLEPEIMALGQAAQRTRTAPGPVAQANMSRQGAAQAPGLPTASAMPFRRGGSVPRSKMARMSAGGKTMDAGERAGKAEGRGSRPTAADERAENADGMKAGGATCMKCGGKAHGGACKMAKGGHTDVAEDTALFKKLYKREESKEKPEMRRGGPVRLAMGGVGKVRHQQSDAKGNPKKERGRQVGNAYSGTKGLI